MMRAVTPKTIISKLAAALTICAAAASAFAADQSVGLREFAAGFTSPVTLIPYPDNSGRLLVGDQIGTAHIIDKDGKVRPQTFLDVRTKLAQIKQGFDERGLLGLAFHPKFAENGRLFAFYSGRLRPNAPQGWNHTGKLVEYKVNQQNATVDFSSEKLILEVDEPQDNHNGGQIAFGPDGHLYLALGDGGGANDMGLGHEPEGNAQRTDNLLGKILRLDIDSKQPYGIPQDNPFATNGKGRPEIYAYGLRNPWRFSFDRGGSRQLFAADVGQNMWEEVNIIVKGGNYGWRVREGFHCFDPKSPEKPPQDCPKVGALGEPLLDPAFEYRNMKNNSPEGEKLGISINGGYVYRGKALPHLTGKYVFADWSQNWALGMGVMLLATPPDSANGKWTVKQLALASHEKGTIQGYIVGMGEDADGELYVLTNASNGLVGKTGKVYKLVPM
ncbi:MAG TPA: PQQ-dependent sugar dehydrogenase [Methylomirabilota bacterium]|nr:PQQ-dependent sugar dehydrogenase [Methylomirabilota bacterium]